MVLIWEVSSDRCMGLAPGAKGLCFSISHDLVDRMVEMSMLCALARVCVCACMVVEVCVI